MQEKKENMSLIESFRNNRELVRKQKAQKKLAEEKAKESQTSGEHLLPMLKMANSDEIKKALLGYFNRLNLKNPPVFKPQLGCGDEGQGKNQPRRLYAAVRVDIDDPEKVKMNKNNGIWCREYIEVTISCIKDQLSFSFYDGKNNHVFTSFEELLNKINQ